MTRYRTIVADPPWPLSGGGPRSFGPNSGDGSPGTWNAAIGHRSAKSRRHRLPYPSMTVADIGALDIANLAEDNAHLYLWTTNAFLRDAYTVVEGWGFKPSTVLVWAKPPKGLGLGGAYSITTEFVLFARRGKLPPLRRWDSTWFGFKWQSDAGVRSHSKKPDAFLDIVEQVSPGPYLEIFARRARFGWDYAGDGSLGTVEIPGLRAPGEREAA